MLMISCPESCTDVTPLCNPPPSPVGAAAIAAAADATSTESTTSATSAASAITPAAVGDSPPPPPTAPQGRCTDDPSYFDLYDCASWGGWKCEDGGWGVSGADRIAFLMRSCPVACYDVTPVCNPPSPPPGAAAPPTDIAAAAAGDPPPPPPPLRRCMLSSCVSFSLHVLSPPPCPSSLQPFPLHATPLRPSVYTRAHCPCCGHGGRQVLTIPLITIYTRAQVGQATHVPLVASESPARTASPCLPSRAPSRATTSPPYATRPRRHRSPRHPLRAPRPWSLQRATPPRHLPPLRVVRTTRITSTSSAAVTGWAGNARMGAGA